MLRLIKNRTTASISIILMLIILIISGCSGGNENSTSNSTIAQAVESNTVSEKPLSENKSDSSLITGLKELKVHFINVGQADSILIHAPVCPGGYSLH